MRKHNDYFEDDDLNKNVLKSCDHYKVSKCVLHSCCDSVLQTHTYRIMF